MYQMVDLSKGPSQDKNLAGLVPIILMWEIWCHCNLREFEEIPLNITVVGIKCLNWMKDLNTIIKPREIVPHSESRNP